MWLCARWNISALCEAPSAGILLTPQTIKRSDQRPTDVTAEAAWFNVTQWVRTGLVLMVSSENSLLDFDSSCKAGIVMGFLCDCIQLNTFRTYKRHKQFDFKHILIITIVIDHRWTEVQVLVLQWTVIQWVSCESTLVNHVSVCWRAQQIQTDLLDTAAHYRVCAMMRINTESLTGVTTAGRSSAKKT